MLSDTDGMIGGETYIKKRDGEVQKVRRKLILLKLNYSH